VKSPEDIQKMRDAGRVSREVLDVASRCVRPGITTDEIDRIVHEACIERGAYPSPLNYRFSYLIFYLNFLSFFLSFDK